MSRPRLRTRDRRALLLGLVAVLPFAAYRTVVEPWLAYRGGLHDTLVAERDLLAKERALIDQGRAGLPARAAELEARVTDADPWLLPAANDVAAGGLLTRQVTDAAQSAGVLVQEVRANALGPLESGLAPISVTVRALGDLEGLARLLFQLENAEVLLHVAELSLRTAGMNDGDLQRGQLMSGGFVIVGYWRAVPDAEPRARPAP